MPRRPRIKLAGHIVQRGINREPCFFAEEDCHAYLHWLEKAAADFPHDHADYDAHVTNTCFTAHHSSSAVGRVDLMNVYFDQGDDS